MSAYPGGSLAAQTPQTPEKINITAGISRMEELEKRYGEIFQRLQRLGLASGSMGNNLSEKARTDVDPPRPEVLTFRLMESARRHSTLASLLEDEVAKLELALLG